MFKTSPTKSQLHSMAVFPELNFLLLRHVIQINWVKMVSAGLIYASMSNGRHTYSEGSPSPHCLWRHLTSPEMEISFIARWTRLVVLETGLGLKITFLSWPRKSLVSVLSRVPQSHSSRTGWVVCSSHLVLLMYNLKYSFMNYLYFEIYGIIGRWIIFAYQYD